MSSNYGYWKVSLVAFFIFSIVVGAPAIGQSLESSPCHIEISVDPASPETVSVGATLNLIATAYHDAPEAVVTLSESDLPQFASGWDGKVDTCGFCSVIDTAILQPSYSDGGEYAFRFIATSTYGDGLADTLLYNLTVLEVCEGPFILPEPPYTKDLTNTIYWYPAEGAYFQSVCVFDSLNPDSVFGCLELKGKIACETLTTTFENLLDGHCYGYYVNAIFIVGPDTFQIQSNIEYSTQDNSPPDTVLHIRALADSGGIIAIYWDTVGDFVSYVDSYYVYRKEDGDPLEFLVCLPADLTAYRDSLSSGSGLVEGETYYFLVRALDAVGNLGEGVLSNPVVPDSTPPCKPEMCWYERCGYDYRYAYFYYKKRVGNTICIEDMNSRPECQGVKLAHWARFQAARDSLKYFEDEFMPGIIFFDSGWLSYDSLLNDTLTCDPVCCICHYFDFVKEIQDTSFVHSHKYLYRVQTKDSLGNVSPWSSPIREAYQDAYPPGDISNLFVDAVLNPDTMSGYMTIRWNAADDPISGVDFYQVYRKIGEFDTFEFIGTTSTTHYEDPFSEIDTSTIICYRTGSIDNVGNERAVWNTQWEACARCPLGPHIEIVYSGCTDSAGNKYTAQDTASVCWPGYDITEVVEYKVVITGAADTVVYQQDPSAECVTIPLPADGEYFVVAQVLFTGSEVSTWSNADSIIRHTTPPQPGGLRVENAPDSNDWSGNIYLEWGAASSPVPVHYEIHRSDSLVYTTSDTYWVDEYADSLDDTLVVYQCYEYYVCAVNCLDLRGCSPDTGSDYCNRPPTIDSDICKPGEIIICWARAHPNPSNVSNTSIEICEDSLKNPIDTESVFNDTCFSFYQPETGHNYIFRVMEFPKDLDLPTCSDETLHSAWSKPCVVPYDNPPDTLDNLVLQPQPYPQRHDRRVRRDRLRENTKPPPGCIFVSWDSTYSDSSVHTFLVVRWLQSEAVDTFWVDAREDGDFVTDTMINSCWPDSMYKFTVIAVDTFQQHSVGNDTDSVAIHPPWVFTPDIRPFKPRCFCDTTLTVRWGWQDLVDGDTVWVDTTFGAGSCCVQISIDPNFRYHVTESCWVAAQDTSFTFALPDYVNENNNLIYARVKAKDHWNHESPWSAYYFGLSTSLIYDCIPPPPVEVGISCEASVDPPSGFLDVWLTWLSVEDELSGTSHYNIYRCDLLIDTVRSGKDTCKYVDRRIPADTVLDLCWCVEPVDSVGNRGDCDTVRLPFLLEPPKCVNPQGVKSVCWCSVLSPVPRVTVFYRVSIADEIYHFGLPIPDLVIDTDSLVDTCYTDTSGWDSVDDTTYFRVCARALGFQSSWSIIVRYPPDQERPYPNLDVVDTSNTTPKTFALSQNYPNPFRASTTIFYQLPKDGEVVVEIFNAAGQKIKTFPEGCKVQGFHSIFWDCTDDSDHAVPAGIYLYRIRARKGNKEMFLKTKKMVVLK